MEKIFLFTGCILFNMSWGLAVEASQAVISEWVAIEIDLETTQTTQQLAEERSAYEQNDDVSRL